ncbi:hypothetical protein AALB39_29010 [Lachnospiraceae bacterium 54-53]
MENISADYWLILFLITDFAPTTALFKTDDFLLLSAFSIAIFVAASGLTSCFLFIVAGFNCHGLVALAVLTYP